MIGLVLSYLSRLRSADGESNLKIAGRQCGERIKSKRRLCGNNKLASTPVLVALLCPWIRCFMIIIPACWFQQAAN